MRKTLNSVLSEKMLSNSVYSKMTLSVLEIHKEKVERMHANMLKVF